MILKIKIIINIQSNFYYLLINKIYKLNFKLIYN